MAEAPAFRNAALTALVVEPVVRTSSITSNRDPFTIAPAGTAKAWATLCARRRRSSKAWI
jgi:hypothetical protein